jgi:phosphatidylserine/phosphatidylglycerophosphate/cardiolipin synthase-like enzyme
MTLGIAEASMAAVDFQAEGTVAEALFTLKLHRGEGMLLLAMNWKQGQPLANFVGFAIEYCEPGGKQFYPLKNRLTFDGNAGNASSATRPPRYMTTVAPIQKFRWVHFPRYADLTGEFVYRVTPVFMGGEDSLSYGVAQTASITLARETYPGVLNVAFTRGFVSSQAFMDNFLNGQEMKSLVPGDAKEGLSFRPTNPKAKAAYDWMGFEARKVILETLDAAIADQNAEVGVVAFDLNLLEFVDKLAALGKRAKVIIDDSDDHHGGGAAEDGAEMQLKKAGVAVIRQSMGKLQHNKTIYVDGPTVQRVICGSTNDSWRGFYVQSNHAVVLSGPRPVEVFKNAFAQYWNKPKGFKKSASAEWQNLGIQALDASVAFSPHSTANSVLKSIADDIRTAASSLFYSLAFLSITPGVIRDALAIQTNRDDIFVAGISDQRTGIAVASGHSNTPPVYVAALDKSAPSPFREEAAGTTSTGGGTRMHHKFIVVDFDRPSARVYLGSYNMSKSADGSNGENLLLFRDRRIATSFMIEAVRMIDHYEFRVARKEAKDKRTNLTLKRPPRNAGETPWWQEDYISPRKIKDRMLFA